MVEWPKGKLILRLSLLSQDRSLPGNNKIDDCQLDAYAKPSQPQKFENKLSMLSVPSDRHYE